MHKIPPGWYFVSTPWHVIHLSAKAGDHQKQKLFYPSTCNRNTDPWFGRLIFKLFSDSFWGYWTTFIFKKSSIFQSSYLVHARKFSWNPCWLERNLITTLVWIERKETCAVKKAIEWGERVWHDLKNTQVDYNISHILIQSWYSSPCQECLFGGTTC